MAQEAPDLSKLRVRGCDLFLLVSLQGLATVGLRERQAFNNAYLGLGKMGDRLFPIS